MCPEVTVRPRCHGISRSFPARMSSSTSRKMWSSLPAATSRFICSSHSSSFQPWSQAASSARSSNESCSMAVLIWSTLTGLTICKNPFHGNVRTVTTDVRGQRNLQANAQPAYAEGFGVAGAHMSRRSEAKEERRTSNFEEDRGHRSEGAVRTSVPLLGQNIGNTMSIIVYTLRLQPSPRLRRGGKLTNDT